MIPAPTPVREGHHQFVEDRAPEWLPDNSLDRKIAQARSEMGEPRWAELNAEWETE